MTQDRALQITFVGGEYGWGNFPFTNVLAEVSQRIGAKSFDEFQVMSNRGRPRLRIDGDLPVPGDELGMYGVIRHGDLFDGKPLPSTIQKLNETQMPVLEITWPDSVSRVYYPARYRHAEPYVGRVYEVFKSDCYSLVREYLIAHGYTTAEVLPLGVVQEAMKHAELFGRDFFLDSFLKVGFQTVMNAQPGDVIVIGAHGQPLHAAALLADGRILHHSPGRFSVAEVYDGYWKQSTLAIFRYVKV